MRYNDIPGNISHLLILISMYQMPLETLLCFYYHAFNPNPNATSKSTLVIERQRAKNKATQLHSVVLDSILRFDTTIRYSDSILRVVGGGCMSIVRSAITICTTNDQAVCLFVATGVVFCDGKLV